MTDDFTWGVSSTPVPLQMTYYRNVRWNLWAYTCVTPIRLTKSVPPKGKITYKHIMKTSGDFSLGFSACNCLALFWGKHLHQRK